MFCSVIAITVSTRIPRIWIHQAHRTRRPLLAAPAHLAASRRILTAIRLLPVTVQTHHLRPLADRRFNIRVLRHRPLIHRTTVARYEVAPRRTGKVRNREIATMHRENAREMYFEL